MIEKKIIKEKAKFIINTIKNKFITEEGLLSRNFPPTNRTLFDNFDDIVPFFIYFNEEQFLINQIKIINKNNYNLLTLCTENELIITRNIDEWFGGLYTLFEKNKNNDVNILLNDSINFVKKNIIKNNNLYAAFNTRNNKTCYTNTPPCVADIFIIFFIHQEKMSCYIPNKNNYPPENQNWSCRINRFLCSIHHCLY